MGVMAAPPQPPNGISGGSVPSFVPFCCIPDGRWVWLWRGGRALCASTAPYLALQIWTGSSTSCESIQGGGGVRAGSSQRRAAPGGVIGVGGGTAWRSVPAWHPSQQKIELPVTDNVQTIPPPYVVRTILVLGRPGCQPQFSVSEQMKVKTPPSPAPLPPPWAEHQFLHAAACGAVLASPPAEDAAVPLFLLRRRLYPQWGGGEGGRDQLEGMRGKSRG